MKGEVYFNNSYNMSFTLEKFLFSNGFFAQRGDGLSIAFQKHGLINIWQLVCPDCAYEENGTVKVYDEVFRLRFHQRFKLRYFILYNFDLKEWKY